MANEYLEELYEDVFNRLNLQIENQREGVLYKIVHKLLETEESEANEICNRIGIKNNALLDDDQEIVEYLIDKPNLFILANNNWLKQAMRNNAIMNPDKAKFVWIVVVGCILVGVPYCIRYVNKWKLKPRGNERKAEQQIQPSQLPSPRTAALCLVVPASVLSDLRDKHLNGLTDNRLSKSELETLIDNTSYFLCTTIEDANLKQQDLEMTNEEIPVNSKREIYIKTHIDYAERMIGKETLYSLKKNLPIQGQCLVQKYACLKSLAGLKAFNRV